jgi:predicted CxxxxCH...CXXCH cytochrome family protein
MSTPARARGALVTAAALCALASCTDPRELPVTETGMHPVGWAQPKSADFHAKWFQAHRDDATGEAGHIAECQKCHGADFGGGGVGVACTTSGCHTKKGGPEFCGTCHGSDKGPMPTSGDHLGAHAIHQAFCADCHDVPQKVDWPNHINGKIDVRFAGLALANGSQPTYDPASKTCANVYCHAATTPRWQTPTAPAPCDFCHQTPPDSHARWAYVATPKSCATCHPAPTKPEVSGKHLDTKIEIRDDLTCWTCHGSAPSGAPAPALDGSTDTTSAGVGAHQRHLDAKLPGRIGHVVACDRCHNVPTNWWDPGHILDAQGKLDDAAPADVSLPYNGTFDTTDPKNPTCVVACHFDQVKVWTADKPGTVPACTSCHGFPPLTLRDGTPHTQAPANLGACQACHPFSPATHVDGTIDLLP